MGNALHQYPQFPGSKGRDGTSQAAAKAMSSSVTHLRRLAVESLDRLGEATTMEIVAEAGVPHEALQPRLSELRRLGWVEATGERRRNPSGKAAAVLRLTAQGRAEAIFGSDSGPSR